MDFTYKNKNINSFGVMVVKTNHLDLFNRNLEVIKVPGGADLIYWDGGYGNNILEIEGILEERGSYELNQKLNSIREWLEDTRYLNLRFEDGVVLNAFFLEVQVSTKINKNSVRIKIKFTCKKGV